MIHYKFSFCVDGEGDMDEEVLNKIKEEKDRWKVITEILGAEVKTEIKARE